LYADASFRRALYHVGHAHGAHFCQFKRNTDARLRFRPITVRTQYLPEQSNPERTQHVFTYTITIKNTGTVAAQLISRHWVITDANNQVQEVRGLGVVGHQPLLKPGEQFEYTSGTQMDTPQGSMVGEYFFVAEDGHRFEVKIPEFVLTLPHALH
jgi:ApaG protein